MSPLYHRARGWYTWSMKAHISTFRATLRAKWRQFRRFTKKHRHAIWYLGGTAALVIFGALIIWIATMRIPSIDSFEDRQISSSTKILDRNGIVLYDVNQNIRRTVVSDEQISAYVKQAAVAIEDRAFYEHQGIRPSAILRAVIANLTPGGNTQGGSTITQQVVKNTLLSNKRTLTRKLKEWVLAIKLEQVQTKDEILTIYLNEAPYGGSLYGVETAAQTFFGISATEVNLAQAAYLAALPNAPTYFSPYGSHRDKLDERKNLTLDAMAELGYITPDQAAEAKEEVVMFRPPSENQAKALHFVEYVRGILEERYGADTLQQEGLVVTTTLDWTLQQAAEQIVTEEAAKNEEAWNASNQALVAIDPQTGQILTMVGSRGYSDRDIDGAYNIALARRQPGSSFKPIVYGRAFEQGFTPDTKLFDVRTQFSTSCSPFEFTNVQPCYAPENYDAVYKGPVALRNALGESRNVPAVKLLYLVGLNDTLRTAKALGLKTLDRTADRFGLTLVLGGGEVTLLDMTSAYGTFANDGVRVPYTPILKVTKADGTILEEVPEVPNGERVLDAEAVRQLNDVLSDNAARTPLFGANSFFYFPGRDVAGKTGTTNDNKDAWVFGYTPNLAVGVWTGNNDNKPMKKGSAISGPAWRRFMNIATGTRPVQNFPDPAPIPTDRKPVLRGLWWGNESFTVDTISGGLATEFTPPETRREYVIPQPHSILHWITPGDAQGSVPENPSRDGQYRLWEPVVQSWLSQHSGLYPAAPSRPNYDDNVHTENSRPDVTLDIPGQASVNGSVTLGAQASGQRPITRIDFYLGGILVGSDEASPYSVTITPSEEGIPSGQASVRAIAIDNVWNRGEATGTISLTQ
jgi:penicillin-binding protein 1C